MRVIRADVMGICSGVRDALDVAEGVEHPETVTIDGQLVHNETVLARLGERGFRFAPERLGSALPPTPNVMITAHGMSDARRQRLQAAGKRLIDTTCPLVRRVHVAAQTLAAEGYHVLVLGRPGHVEVQGIVEDLCDHEVISSVADVRSYPHQRLGVVCQTTTPPRVAEEIRLAVHLRNLHAEVRFVNTICRATQDRQQAVDRLLPLVDAMVIVGGRNSNNTLELVALCVQRDVAAVHVQSADDVDPAWFDGYQTVGLTAGTSTLDETIDQVYQVLCNLKTGVTP